MSSVRPTSLTLAALGGQGGGVVSGWLVDVARRERHLVQATSVPGVAQRTGATIYYVEFFPEAALPADGRRPVLSLMPVPGDCDVVVASELVEAGRVLQRGLVTPRRTILITSTHRAYTISEKSALGDGRVDAAALLDAARDAASRLVAFDMAAAAERHDAVISAVLLGAIAGAAGLPFAEDSYRAAIRAAGVAVERNLAAFEEGLRQARGTPAAEAPVAAGTSAAAVPAALLRRIDAEVPAVARATCVHGVMRLCDYQDERYAGEYLDALRSVARIDAASGGDARLFEAVARGLALWMSLEDVIRVAELKTRAARRRRIADQVRARPGEILHLSEFLKPRVEEICGTLPAPIGQALQASPLVGRMLRRLTGGRRMRSDTVSGFLLLRSIAGMKRWRRGTLRHRLEGRRIEAWLQRILRLAQRDYALAVEVAESQALVRGYGDTFERGLAKFERIGLEAERLAGQPGAAARIAGLRRIALRDEQGEELSEAIAGGSPAHQEVVA